MVPKWRDQDDHLGVWEVNNTTSIFNLILKLFREGMFYVYHITVIHVIYKYMYFGSIYSKYFIDKICDLERLEMTLPVRIDYAVVRNDPQTSVTTEKVCFLSMLCVLWAIYSPALCHTDTTAQAD